MSATALLPHGLRCRGRHVRRGERVWRDGIPGRFVGWHPDRPAPLVAWQTEQFEACCRYFDALKPLRSFRSIWRALSRTGAPPPWWLLAPWTPVVGMFGVVGLVCLVLGLGAPPVFAVIAAAVPPALIWLRAQESVGVALAALRLRRRLSAAP